MWYAPEPSVWALRIVLQPAPPRRWILTGTQAANDELTNPRATRLSRSRNDTERSCVTVVTTVKLAELVAVPLGVVTLIGPLVAPVGTVAVIFVSEFTVTVVAAVPLNFTAVAPVKAVPVIVTTVPIGPLVGVNDVMASAPDTVKLVELVAVPPGVVTLIGPVVAPVGTVAVIFVSEFTVTVVAVVPLNFTAVAPVKPVPLIVTLFPTAPLVGENDVMVGTGDAVTVKLVALVAVASESVTLSGPVVGPLGTVVVILLFESAENVAVVPLNLTSVTGLEP